MARRQKESNGEVLIGVAAMLPWWVSVSLALVTYVVLSKYARVEVPVPVNSSQVGAVFFATMIKAWATLGQYLVPAILLIGAIVSVIGRMKREKLVESVAGDAHGNSMRNMTWREFEMLVGEAFRKRGFQVQECGGPGADGGIDLVLTRGHERFLVQCKQWKAFKVSVTVVRELYGVMSAKGAAGGFVVTSGVFTEEARTFVKGLNIELIDGKVLQRMIDEVSSVSAERRKNKAPTSLDSEPSCPSCGGAMQKRAAKKGANAGRMFWGCKGYPQCRGIRPID